VALFDETARLLGTTAGIGLVHEPALPIHEGVYGSSEKFCNTTSEEQAT
jgi:hypothetical protein